MRYEYIEPFVSTTIRVLDSVIQSDISKGNISLVRGDEIDKDIAIIIGVRDDSEGSIIVNMDEETALNICNAMNGQTFESLTTLGMDTIAELANMLAGNAASALNNMGFDFKVSPPLVVTQDNVRRKTAGLEIFQIPLFTECGEITVNVAMRTN